MKKICLLCVVLSLMACAGGAMGQEVTTPNAAASQATNKRIHQLDLLIKLEPLALQKDQYTTLIAGLDKARAYEESREEDEDKVLAELDPKVSAAVDNAVQKGIYPPRELQESIQKTLDAAYNKQVITGANMVIIVYNAIQAGLNAGQRKVMVGSFSNAFIDPTMKPEELTDDVKLRFYIRRVLLDTDAYQLLKDMSKHAS